MRYFLAFSYNMHDSSVSIADERKVLLVLEAERYFGDKKKRCDRGEMETLISVALRHCGISIGDVEGVACTAYLNDHLPEKDRNVDWLTNSQVEIAGRKFDVPVLNHHLAHAAMIHAFPAHHPGGDDVVMDVCDGGGDFGHTHFTYRLRDGRIEPLRNRPIHDAFSSRFYDVVSRYLYGRIMSEGKLMALASLGEPRPQMMQYIRDNLPLFHRLDHEAAFGGLRKHFPVEHYASSRTAFDLAASAQRLFEDLRVQSVAELPEDAPRVMLAGGATLNIVANSRVKELLAPKRHLLVPPCCDDTGQSLGALLYYCHEHAGTKVSAAMPFLGYSDSITDRKLDRADVSGELVSWLAGGGIVFLHRGQSEIGPRALGHRSILALPSRKNFDLINHVIKQREFYRPLAPLVPREAVSTWFDWEGESKYMLYAAKVAERTQLLAPGICHYDASARVQTVDRLEDPFLHGLLEQVGQATGCPILINTSLNPRGAPILSKLDATRSFAHAMKGLNIRVFNDSQLSSID
jgi:carbamoyltransferase